MKHFVFVVICLTAACKKDEAAKPATTGSAETSAEANTNPGARPSRDGKIDFNKIPGRWNKTPGAADDIDDEDGEDADDGSGRWDPAKRDEMRQQFEERRKEREKQIDLDGDGKISDEERSKARTARATAMRDRLDANKDGKLSTDEIAGSHRLSRRIGDPTQLDANKDGDISAEELEKGIGGRMPGSILGNGGRRPWRGGSAGSGGAPSGSATP